MNPVCRTLLAAFASVVILVAAGAAETAVTPLAATSCQFPSSPAQCDGGARTGVSVVLAQAAPRDHGVIDCANSVNTRNCSGGTASVLRASDPSNPPAPDCLPGAACTRVLNPLSPAPEQPQTPVARPRELLLQRTDPPAARCYDTTIESPQPFRGKHDEVFRVSDGSWWQVDGADEHLNAYRPRVLVCPGEQQLQIGSVSLQIRVLAPAGSILAASPSNLSDVVSSRIEGDFTGWSGKTNFRLSNGQIWRQYGSGSYSIHLVSPLVVIFRNGSGYEMQVEGASERVSVTRLQ